MAYDNILVETRGAVGLVTLNRLKALNALCDALVRELGAALDAFEADDAIGAVVITGSEKAFAAGADIKEMAGRSYMDVYLSDFITRGWERVTTCRKPVIAAVAGFALGGGCELALACDIRYASSKAKLGQPEVNLAIIPGWGGTQRLARVCGLGMAKDLILTGRTIDAGEALRIGVVSAVYEPEELAEKVGEVARALAAKSPVALRIAKATLNLALHGDHERNLRAEIDSFGELFSSEDAKEGMSAFAEKREPKFTGR
jgi:enoyl-CoA hydratase